MLYVVGDSTMN